MRIDVPCAHCGVMFSVTPHRLHGKKHLFCSRSCMGQFRSVQYKGEGSPTWRGGSIPVTCEVCGKMFNRPPYKVARSVHQFCSPSCVGKWKSQHQRGESHVGYQGGAPEETCDWCNKTYHRFRSQHEKTQARFCSRACQAAWQSKYRVGENCGAWRGGHVTYYGPNWGTQKRAARKRDGFKCCCCGVLQKRNGRALDVHHVQPFKTFGYVPGENENYLQANDLTNLVTLCQKCHKKAEWNKIAIQPYLL